MEFNLQGSSAPMHKMCRKKETRQAADDTKHDENKVGLITDEIDPWKPPFPPCPPCEDDTKSHWEQTNEWYHKTAAFVANSRATNIIIPDRTPQWVSDALWYKTPALVSILEVDDVQRFLHFFENNKLCMTWGFIITPETFNYIISENALRCAKVVLEGKAPELSRHRASPNCMNPYGYFPLHEAAERFSVDMIKLLIKYGASANTRTAGNEIIENLLPLHVAVENTCLHKYLEENLSPNMDHRDYIYKLIQLLCLPEMKIFLDTTRLLAKRTNNLLDEVWNYVKDGKLVQTAVLLLAGQKHIRGVSFSKKRNGIRKQDGFDIIMTRMMKHSVALKWKIGEHRSSQNLPEACSILDSIALLVDIISQAGEALDAYITTHSTVPYVEVFERIDSIIKDYGFFPNGEGIDVGKLCPYDCRMFMKAGKHGGRGATKRTAESAYPAEKGLMANEVGRGFILDLEYTRNSFFPYWRSVLLSHVDVMIYPGYAAADPKCKLNIKKQHNLADKGFSPTAPNHSLGLLGSTAPNHSFGGLLGKTLQATRYHTCSRQQGTGTAVIGKPQVTSTNMTRGLFGTAALTLMKMLKNA